MDKIKDSKLLICIIIAIYAITILVIHWHIVFSGDDVRLTTISLNGIVAKRMADNGRVLTDVIAWIFCQFNIWFWKIFDVIIWVSLAHITAYLWGRVDVKSISISCIIYLLFPFQILSTAGYIATITNYIYTYLAVIISFAIIKKYVDTNENPHWYSYVVVSIALIYANSHDQYAIFAIASLCMWVIFLLLTKKYINVRCISIWSLSVSVVSYCLILLSPGHRFRAHAYGTWIPNYNEWTVFDKIYHGYTSTVAYIFYKNLPFVFAFFVLLLLASILLKNKLAIIASSCCMLVEGIRLLVGFEDPMEEPVVAFHMPEIGVLTNAKNMCMLVMSFLLIIGIFIALWLVLDNNERIFAYSILTIGSATRVAMGFSESLYGSSYRTYTFFNISVLLVLAMLIKRVFNSENRIIKIIGGCTLFACILWQLPASMASLI